MNSCPHMLFCFIFFNYRPPRNTKMKLPYKSYSIEVSVQRFCGSRKPTNRSFPKFPSIFLSASSLMRSMFERCVYRSVAGCEILPCSILSRAAKPRKSIRENPSAKIHSRQSIRGFLFLEFIRENPFAHIHSKKSFFKSIRRNPFAEIHLWKSIRGNSFS